MYSERSEQGIDSSSRSGKNYSGYSYDDALVRIPSVGLTTLAGIMSNVIILYYCRDYPELWPNYLGDFEYSPQTSDYSQYFRELSSWHSGISSSAFKTFSESVNQSST